MYSFTEMCFLCHVHDKNIIQSISLQDIDGVIIEDKLKNVLFEIGSYKPDIPKNICVDCLKGVNFVYTFRQKCLDKFVTLKQYLNEHFEPEVIIKTEPEPEKFQEVFIKQEHTDLAEESDTDYDPLSKKKESKPEETSKRKQKIHECSTCNKVFKTAQHLERHNIIHTGLRPKCDICSKTFSDSSGLKSHKRIHNFVKPYKCSLCPKIFTQSGHLSNHMTTHSKEKKYECNLCDYKCAFSGNLKLHMRVHTGDKPHVCQFCQRSFSRPESKARHIKRKHSEANVVE